MPLSAISISGQAMSLWCPSWYHGAASLSGRDGSDGFALCSGWCPSARRRCAGATGLVEQGIGNIPGTAFGEGTDASLVPISESFRPIHSVLVGQQYDSTMPFASTSSPAEPDDYVTTAIPQLWGMDVGSLVMVSAMARAVGEYYAKNTERSYVGASAGGVVDVSQLTSRLWEGAQLTRSDLYGDTPQSPDFVMGNQSGQGDQSVWERLSNGAGEYAHQSVHRQSGGPPHAGPQHGGQLHERISPLWTFRGAATGPAEPHSGGLLNSHRRDL